MSDQILFASAAFIELEVKELSPIEIARLLGGSPVDGSAELRLLRALQPRLVDYPDAAGDELQAAA